MQKFQPSFRRTAPASEDWTPEATNQQIGTNCISFLNHDSQDIFIHKTIIHLKFDHSNCHHAKMFEILRCTCSTTPEIVSSLWASFPLRWCPRWRRSPSSWSRSAPPPARPVDSSPTLLKNQCLLMRWLSRCATHVPDFSAGALGGSARQHERRVELLVRLGKWRLLAWTRYKINKKLAQQPLTISTISRCL